MIIKISDNRRDHGASCGMAYSGKRIGTKFEGDNPVLIYLPEVAFDTERFIQDVSASLEKCQM